MCIAKCGRAGMPAQLDTQRERRIIKYGAIHPYLLNPSCVMICDVSPTGANALTDDRELLRRARELDEAALGAVFDAYYEPVYRYIYHHVHHQAVAEDLAADVFVRLVDQLHAGRGPARHLRAWIYRVAHNLVVDDARRLVHRDHEPLQEWTAADEPAVEDLVDGTQSAARVRRALGALTEGQRAVIVLKYLEGLGNREIARVLDTSVGAVKALQHRALAALQRRLAEDQAGSETERSEEQV